MALVNEQGTLSKEQLKEACVESFAVYCELMQDDGYFDQVHYMICNWLQKHVERAERELAEGKEQVMLQLALTMPRGSLKSTIVTKRFNEWIVIRRYYKFGDSSTRLLLAGNTFTNAKKKLGGIRGTFEEQLFKTLFPEILPDRNCKWSDEAACIKRSKSFDESTYECGGTGTKLTGRHYNGIIEDDTTAPDLDEMKSSVTRPDRDTIEKAIGFHKASVPLFVPKGFRFSLIVSTRWAFFDLIAHVKAEEDYYHFDMPAYNSEGKPNFSNFYDKESLELIKKKVGSYMFSMLYLNKPLDDSERSFKADLFHYIDKKQVPAPEDGEITIALDPAISEKDDACDSSITVNFRCRHLKEGQQQLHQYWLQDWNGKLLPFQLAAKFIKIAIFWHNQGFKIRALIVETVAYQRALKEIIINLLRESSVPELESRLVDFASRTQKEIRIEGMQPSFEQRRIHFLRPCSWNGTKVGVTEQTESQLVQYPDGRLVDTIDSWSMHFSKVAGYDGKVGRVPQREAEPRDELLDFIDKLTKKTSSGFIEMNERSCVAGFGGYGI